MNVRCTLVKCLHLNRHVCIYLPADPDGPPMDVILQPVTSQSIRVTWKVEHDKLLPSDKDCLRFCGNFKLSSCLVT